VEVRIVNVVPNDCVVVSSRKTVTALLESTERRSPCWSGKLDGSKVIAARLEWAYMLEDDEEAPTSGVYSGQECTSKT
jgi:hypothetical protein